MSFDELEARGVGTGYDRIINRERFLSIEYYFDSYAGAMARTSLSFNSESEKLEYISIIYELSNYNNAPTWFELYRKFTELFGEPQEAFGTNSFTTPDELRTMLKSIRSSHVIWEVGDHTLNLSLYSLDDDDWMLMVRIYDVPQTT